MDYGGTKMRKGGDRDRQKARVNSRSSNCQGRRSVIVRYVHTRVHTFSVSNSNVFSLKKNVFKIF